MEYDGKNKSPYYGVWQSALMLAFTFTNLPKLLKKNKLILLPLSNIF